MRFVSTFPPALLALVVAAGGCLTDAVAPAPPVLDALRARTSLPTLHVTGVAEYNATITVTGGTKEATTAADALTGRFAVEVSLAAGDNALKVLASDAADNTSDPVELTIVREPARAEIVHVALPRTTVSADDGTLEVVVDVANDEPEIALASLGVTLSIPEDDAFVPVPVVVNDTGHAVVVLDERRAQGTFTLRVQADVSDLDGNAAFDQAGFTIVPGRPENVDVALSATVDGTDVPPTNAITVPAATAVNVDVVVTDAHDNVIPDTQIAIDAPGAGGTILGDRIVDLTRAGTFTVVADTGIALVAGTATLTVTAAAADHVELALSADRVAAGTAVRATSRVVDAYGNTVTATAPALATTAPQGFAAPLVDEGVAAAVATVTTAGSYTVTATDPASQAVPASLSLTVVPGAPVDPDFIAVTAGPHRAGDDVVVTYALKDAFGNVNTSLPVTVTTSAPGAFIDDDGRGTITLSDITLAGTYTVRGRAAGTGLDDDIETLVVTAAAADHVVLSTSDALVQAGTAVRAVARVVDRFDNVVTDTVPTVEIDAPQAFGAPLVDGGVATANVTVTTAGSFTITASDPASSATPASEPLQIVAATAVNASFIEIDPTGLPYHAGAPVRVNYGFVDAFGNENTSTPLVVTVNAPNVTVVDTGAGVVEIDGIVRAGSYVVRGHAAGTGLTDDLETLVIDPNPQLAGFNLVLSAALTAEFGTVVFNGTDGFGNLIDQANITTTLSDPTAITRVGSELTFNRAGSYSITACITGTTLCDTEFMSVQGLLDTVPPSATVTVESPVSGSTVVRNQRVVFGVVVTDDRALSSLSFVATFGSSGTCRTTGGPLLFAGTTSESRTFSFTVPTCAIPLDAVSIVAQASDQAGNTSNTADETLSVANPFSLNVAASGGGGAFLTTVAAFQDRLDGPSGVDVDPISGTIYVGNSGLQGNRANRAVGITIDRVQFDLTDQTGSRVDLRDVRGVAASAAGTLFFGVSEVTAGGGGSSGIIRVTRDLLRQTFVSSNTPGGQAEAITQAQQVVNQLTIDESTSTPALCMVIQQQDHVWCYTNLDGTASRLAEVEINGLRPRGIAIDGPDNGADADVLFVALDNTTHVIRPFTFNADRSTLTAGTDISLTTVVDANGNPTAGITNNGVLGDLVVGPQPSENLYLADRSGDRILKIDRATTPPTVSVFVSNVNSPTGLAFDGDALLVTDDQDRVVFRIVPDPANPGAF